jgi:hypothetical protein
MLVLSICEFYNPCLHGRDDSSSPNIDGQILCCYSVPREKIFRPRGYPFRFVGCQRSALTYWWDVKQTAYWKNNGNGALLNNVECDNLIAYGHPIIRNYFPIIRARGIRFLEIVEMIYLEPGGECVCILKTVWLRIFQRKVRNWIQNKLRVASYLKRSRFLMLSECCGINCILNKI